MTETIVLKTPTKTKEINIKDKARDVFQTDIIYGQRMSKEDEDKVMKSIGILPPAKNFRLKSTPTIHLASDQSQRVQKTVKKVVDKSKNSIQKLNLQESDKNKKVV